MPWNRISVISVCVAAVCVTTVAWSKNLGSFNESEDALIVKAILGEESGQFGKSRTIYEKLFRRTGNKEYLIQEAKNTLLQKGDPSHSIQNLLDWITKHPDDRDREVYRMLVALYIQKGALDDAEEVADEYLSSSDSAEEIAAVAALKLELGKPAEALRLLDKAYAKEPEDKLVIRRAMILNQSLGRKKEAIALLEKHLADYDRSASIAVYFKLIELYAKDKKMDKVLELYKKLYRQNPQKFFLQKIIEISLYEKKIDALIGFLEKSEHNEEILYTFYKDQRYFDKAITLTDLLYQRTKKPKWLAEKAILIYEKARQEKSPLKEPLKQVQELFERAITQGITESVYLNYYGYTLINHDIDLKQGIHYIRKALKRQPNNAYYLDSLAWGLYKQKKCEAAYRVMQKVIEKEGLKEEEIREHWELIKKCQTTTDKRNNNKDGKARGGYTR